MTNLRWQKTRKKMLLTWLVYFPPITLLFYNGIPEFMRKSLMLTLIFAQTTQNSWNFVVRKSSLLKKWQTSAIIWEISYSNLDTGRYGPKSGVSRIIRESRQHAWWENCLSFFEGNVRRSPGLLIEPEYYGPITDYRCLELKTYVLPISAGWET